MSIMEDREEQEAREKREKKYYKEREARKAEDVRAVMEKPEMRRLVMEFFKDANVDLSPLRPDPLAMAHAVGWQDAAGFWMNLIRRYCPEREAQMRAEAKRDVLTNNEPDEETDP
jgi:hypothetical protein